MYPYIIAVPFAVLLAVYLVFEGKKNFRVATTLKLCLSGIFTAVAWSAVVMDGASSLFGVFTAAALTVAIAGDFFLQYINLDNRKYITGINFFAATQVLLVIGLYTEVPFHFVDLLIYACVLLVIFLSGMLKWDTKAQQPYIIIYVMTLAFMASKSVSCCLFNTDFIVTAVGGCLFLVSDIVLGVWKYKTGKMCHAYANWLLYFPGQLLIAFGMFSVLF